MVAGWWFACGLGPSAGDSPEVMAAWDALAPTELAAYDPPPAVPSDGPPDGPRDDPPDAVGATLAVGAGATEVWVTAGGAVVPGAAVELWAEGAPIAAASTDRRGLVRFDGVPASDAPLSARVSVGDGVAVVTEDQVGPYGVGRSPVGAADVRVHTVADRAAARPGDPIRVRSTFRLATLGGLERSRAEVRWLLSDPTGAEADGGEGALDEWGGISLEAHLPPDAASGDWLVSVLAVGDTWNAVARAPVRVGDPVEVAPTPTAVPSPPPPGDLPLVAEAPTWSVGDTARIRIGGPPGVAWVAIGREGTTGSQVVSAPGVVEIPIVSAHRPNVFVSAVSVGPGGVHLGRIALRVDPEPERLAVRVTPRGGTVRSPGEEVPVDVVVTRGGKPVADAGLTLFGVDPGAAAPVTDPFDAFYTPRALGVRTADPRFAGEAAAAPQGVAHVGTPGFVAAPGTTSRWHEGRTGPDGGATASFAVPAGELRIFAVATSESAAFGLGTATLASGPPIGIEAPPWLRVGDTAFARVTLRNPDDRGRRVEVDPGATGGLAAVGATRIDVPAHHEREVRVLLSARAPGAATLELGPEARVPVRIEPAVDASPGDAAAGWGVERTVRRVDRAGPVRVGTEIVVTLSVSTDAARADVSLSEPIPAGFDPLGPGEGSGAFAAEWVGEELRLRAAELPAGHHTWAYRLRARTPGVFTHPQAIVRAGDATAHTDPATITVGPSRSPEAPVEPVDP